MMLFALVLFQFVKRTERRKRREQDTARIPHLKKVNMTLADGGALTLHYMVSRVIEGEEVYWAERVRDVDRAV